MFKSLLFIFVCLVFEALAQNRPGCKIDITKLTEPAPLVLNPKTYEYVYPSTDNIPGDQTVFLQPGEAVLVACPGGTLTTIPSSTIYVTCNEKHEMVLDDKPISFNSLTCTKSTDSTRITSTKCSSSNNNAKIIQVGYEIGVGLKWVPLLDVCFDFVTKSSLYTKFQLTKSIRYREYGYHAIEEQENIYNFSKTIPELYRKSLETINTQIGLEPNSHDLASLPFYRTRLTSQTEIFYSSQNEAVSVAINTFPEWPKYCYNWRDVDVTVQHYAIRHEVDLEVYTGTFGQVNAKHSKTSQNVTLNLYVEEDVKALPVPGLIWRLAYEPISTSAVVFLTVNVPIQELYEEFVICDDVSDSVKWQPWIDSVKHDYNCGYSYTCTYDSFKSVVTHAPQLKVAGLLL